VQGIRVSLMLVQMLLCRVQGVPGVGAADDVQGIMVTLMLVQLSLCRVSEYP
jgi:hypothetical protein